MEAVLDRAEQNGFLYIYSDADQIFDGSRIVVGTEQDIARLKGSSKGTLLVRYQTSEASNQVIFAVGKDTQTGHYGALLANNVLQRSGSPGKGWSDIFCCHIIHGVQQKPDGRIYVGLLKPNGTYDNGSAKYTIDWEYKYQVTGASELFAYSSLVELSNGKVGMIYEASPTDSWADGL